MLVLISDRKELSRLLAVSLTEGGVFLFRTPLETGEFYCEKKDTGGVLLDCVPNLGRGEILCRRLRKRWEEMPIGVIVPPDSTPNLPADRIIRDCKAGTLTDEALRFCREGCGWVTRPLSTYYLTVGATPDDIVYMNYRMKLSAVEHRILRCLFYRAPALTSADDLMTLCFPEGGTRISNLTVQISRINQRAAEIDPRPLIVNEYGKGYRIRDGIL